MLTLSTINCYAALITHSYSGYDNINADTGQTSDPLNVSEIGRFTYTLPGFESSLGTLTQVSFSYFYSTSYYSTLQVRDPSAGLTSEENVHGKGEGDYSFVLGKNRNVPPNFMYINESNTFQLECKQNDQLIGDIVYPAHGHCRDSGGESLRSSGTLQYTSLDAMAYFINKPIKIPFTGVIFNDVKYCDDTEDWCQIVSNFSINTKFDVSYQYTPNSITAVPEPSALGVFSLSGVALLFMRRRKNRLTVIKPK
jgi:hypothetical protein